MKRRFTKMLAGLLAVLLIVTGVVALWNVQQREIAQGNLDLKRVSLLLQGKSSMASASAMIEGLSLVNASEYTKQPHQSTELVMDAKGEVYKLIYTHPSMVDVLMGQWAVLLVGVVVALILALFGAEAFVKVTEDLVNRFSNELTSILKGEDDKDRKAIAISNELSYSREVEQTKQKLTESLSEIVENEKLRRDFTANVSHELNTPLTSINGYAEMIASGMTVEEDSRHFAQIILSEGERLLELINETLQLSKFDAGTGKIGDVESIQLLDLVSDTLSTLQAYAYEKNVALILKGEPCTIEGNRRMIIDIVTNLVGNAIKYNNPQGLVRLKVAQTEKYAILQVKDTGLGISSENQQRIFERFYVVDKSRSKNSGTGLGLSLVKHMVRAHRGEVGLKSTLGKGSTFTVKLPKVYVAEEKIENEKMNEEM